MTQPENVRIGDLMAFTYWSRVQNFGLRSINSLLLHDVDADMDFEVHGEPLIVRAQSADRYDKEEDVTKTRAAEILVSSYNVPFTVVFEKQNGDIRHLRGRLVKPEPLLGRSMCEDLDITEMDKRMRLVDHRTIKSIIVGGVRYNVK